MKKPFTLEAWLKDKSQEVINNHNGKEVHLLEYDLRPANSFNPIIGYEEPGGENLHYAEFDLFIVTPEEEMTEWQRFISACLQKYGLLDCSAADRIAKESAAELLDLARKEILKGENIMTVSGPGLFSEGETRFTNMPIADALKAEYEKGKAEALKDLPRWRKWENGVCGNGRGNPLAIVKRGLNGHALVDALGIQGEQYIMLSDLEKLPGFKED